MSNRLQVHASEPGFWVGRWKNLAIQYWGSEVTVARVDRCGECNNAVLREYPDRLVTFALVFPTASPRIGAEERKRIDEISKKQSGTTLVSVQVIEGTGFWASTVRAILISLNMLSRTRQRVFAAENDAVEWLIKEGHVSATTAELSSALREARSQYLPV